MKPIPKKKAAGAGAPEAALDATRKSNNTSIPKKWERVLRAFVSGKSYNRFEAEKHLSDHALHSTVSYIQNLGVTIHREFEEVPGFMGLPTRVCRYWLDHESGNLRKAKALLPASQQQGGV